MKKFSLAALTCGLISALCISAAAAPTITEQPADVPGTSGGTVTFSCTAKSDSDMTYIWCWYNTATGKRTAFTDTDKGSTPYIHGTHTDTLTIEGLPASYVGLSVSCYVKDEKEAVWTESADITEGLCIKKQPVSVQAKVGDTITLECEANADDAVYTWCWYYEASKSWPKLKNTEDDNGFALIGADTGKLTVKAVTAPYIGLTYACHVSSESLGAGIWSDPIVIYAAEDTSSEEKTDDGKTETSDDKKDDEKTKTPDDKKDDEKTETPDDKKDDEKTETSDDKKDDEKTETSDDKKDDEGSGSEVTVGDGEDAVLHVDADGDSYTYEWQYEIDGVAESLGCTEDTLVIPADELDKYADAVFYCIVTDTVSGEMFVTDDMILVIPGKEDEKDDGKDEQKEEEKQETGEKDDKKEESEALPFTDVAEDSWYYGNVELAYKSGLINGMTDTEFAPTGNLTYAQAVKLAACLHQYYNEGEVTLTVSETGLWYESYMQYCIENGLIDREQGEERLSRPDIIIDANSPISREAYAVLFADALPEKALAPINDVPDGSIPDVEEENNFYGPAIYKFYRAGITIGRDAKGTFDPHANITRAEISAILARLIDADMRQEVSAEFGK